ncbi:ABC transporter substrate-binding protein [Desulfobacterales bacterium HSG2]|nr:ABC transporter substrate-binding protein [Desulfobacterales bacterium HSG2]
MKKIQLSVIILMFLMILSQAVWAETAETIKIGFILSRTGVAADGNVSLTQGLRIAVKEINDMGGVIGKKLEPLLFDNRSTPIGSKIATDRAVKAGVCTIIGANWSSFSLVAAKVAQANRIPMIADYATNSDVTRTGDYIFRICFTDPFQGKAMAQFARNDLETKTAVILKNVSSDYSMGLAQEFRKLFESLGGKILLELKYIQNEKNFRKLLEQTKQVSPDALFVPGQFESGAVVMQAQEMGITAIPLGGDGWGGTNFYKKGGSSMKLGYYSTHWSEESDRKISREFLKRLQAHGPVDAGTVLVYDAVSLLARAIEKASSSEPGKIRDALARTSNFEGITGSITFDENGDPIKDVVIMQIRDGKAHYLKTMEP